MKQPSVHETVEENVIVCVCISAEGRTHADIKEKQTPSKKQAQQGGRSIRKRIIGICTYIIIHM